MSEVCGKVHQLVNNMKRFYFSFSQYELPKNGVYLLFEAGEKAHGADRIVRVGTHVGNDQLRSRLRQHFINENKDRSIFRKNIGRALLHKDADPFLQYWELDLTTREARKRYGAEVNLEKLRDMERRVSKFIQDNMSFVVFAVADKSERMQLESRIISTVSACKDCRPSENWLGLFSPKSKITTNGLWLVNELYKVPLEEKDIENLYATVANYNLS